jgi:hypothetical protein
VWRISGRLISGWFNRGGICPLDKSPKVWYSIRAKEVDNLGRKNPEADEVA